MVRSVGYVGLGNMGKPIATNVVKAGFELTVFDIREEPLMDLAALDARVAGSPREVAAHSEMVELSLVDDAQVEAVSLGPDGLLSGAKPGMIIAIHSTIHPRTVKHVAEVARASGVRVVDATLSGGSSGARAHTLCYMVGGDAADVETCRPVFETSAGHIFHVGPVGMGAAIKLAQQVIICLNRLAAFEGMQLAEKAGVDLQVLQQIAHVTTAQSQVADNWTQQYRRIEATDSTDAEGLAHLFWKGLCPALELGHDLGVPMPATALVQQLFPQVLGIRP